MKREHIVRLAQLARQFHTQYTTVTDSNYVTYSDLLAVNAGNSLKALATHMSNKHADIVNNPNTMGMTPEESEFLTLSKMFPVDYGADINPL